jgi:hypothetical protein
MTAIFTIVSKNYLAFARTLMQSVRAHHPEMARFVILVDRVDGVFEPEAEDFTIVTSDLLPIPRSRWFHFKYNVLELNTAVKPFAIEHLSSTWPINKLFYLDPDIRLYSPLSALEKTLDTSNIILTPHLLAPIADDGEVPGDFEIARAGAYNLGFIGLKINAATNEFVKWWERKLYDGCYIDFHRGLFTDQKWIDLVPGAFPGVHIERSPRYNVAYWNIAERRIEARENGPLVNGEPLGFFHFSGFDPLNPQRFSKYQTRFTLAELGDTGKLAEAYAREVISNGFEDSRKWPYAYGFFHDGTPVLDICRGYARDFPQLMDAVADPFSTEGLRSYTAFWTAPAEEFAGSGIPRLALAIHKHREDLRRLIPDLRPEHRDQLLQRVVALEKTEYGLSEAMLHSLDGLLFRTRREELEAARRERDDAATGQDDAATEQARLAVESRVQEQWRKIPTSVAALLLDRAHEVSGLIANGSTLVDWLGEPVSRNGSTLPRLAWLALDRRQDLRLQFPEVLAADGSRFLAWFVTYGRVEYALTSELLRPLRTALAGHRNGRAALIKYTAQLAARTLLDTTRNKLTAPPKAAAPVQVSVRVVQRTQRAGAPILGDLTVNLNKPCELADFRDVEAAALIRRMEPELAALYADYPRGKEHRKSWEYQQVVRGAARLGALHRGAEVLCFPAGRERTVYELSNRARRVFAADVYGNAETGVCDPFLIDPGLFARQPYQPALLIPCHMDSRFIRFEPESFDLVVCPAFSGYPATKEAAGNLVLEFERVLRPGGLLVLSIELVVNGGTPVLAGPQLYDSALLQEVLSWSAGLRMIGPLQETVDDATAATSIPLADAKQQSKRGELHFPHIVLDVEGRLFTTATVFVRRE